MFDHCRYAGYVAEGLVALLPASVHAFLPSETPFLVSLHDVGKVSPGFEGKYFIDLLREKAPAFADGFVNDGYVTNHASIGAKALLRLFNLPADHPLVRAVAAHHGFAPDRLDFTQDGPWQDERAALVRALAAQYRLHRLADVGLRGGALRRRLRRRRRALAEDVPVEGEGLEEAEDVLLGQLPQ